MKDNAISHLKGTLKDKHDEIDARNRAEQDTKDRIRVIRESPRIKDEDFWCRPCGRDFTARAYRHINWAFNVDLGVAEAPKQWRAWYEAECPKGHMAVRRITDKANDPYYALSEMQRRNARIHADDFMTPEDPRFRVKYPQQYAKYLEGRAKNGGAEGGGLLDPGLGNPQ